MSQCASQKPRKSACSGKCMSGACASNGPRMWVVAACNGMVSLFESAPQQGLTPVLHAGGTVFPSLSAFSAMLQEAEQAHSLAQLVLVGSQSDIAWVHASLPESLATRIAAEIEYPLVSNWFKQPAMQSPLMPALAQVLGAA